VSITAVIALIVSLLAAAFAGLSWRSSAQRTLHQVLEDIRKDYRTPEMYHAVRTLWEFYKDCQKNNEDFVDKYCRILGEDNKRLSRLDENLKLEAEQNTLNYQRRLVSQFYQHVAALYSTKVLPSNIVFRTWVEEDLRIIPNIIIPIETRLLQVVQTPPPHPIDENSLTVRLSALYKLYKDSKEKP